MYFRFFLQTFEEIRSKMLTKGKNFLEAKMQSRSKIAKLGAQNINDGSVSFSSLSHCIASKNLCVGPLRYQFHSFWVLDGIPATLSYFVNTFSASACPLQVSDGDSHSGWGTRSDEQAVQSLRDRVVYGQGRAGKL